MLKQGLNIFRPNLISLRTSYWHIFFYFLFLDFKQAARVPIVCMHSKYQLHARGMLTWSFANHFLQPEDQKQERKKIYSQRGSTNKRSNYRLGSLFILHIRPWKWRGHDHQPGPHCISGRVWPFTNPLILALPLVCGRSFLLQSNTCIIYCSSRNQKG